MSASGSIKRSSSNGSRAQTDVSSFYYLRAYIDMAHFMLSTPGSLVDLVSDADNRLEDVVHGLSLPHAWLSSESEGGATFQKEVSPFFEAIYAVRRVATQLDRTKELVSRMEPKQLQDHHIVALVMSAYTAKSLDPKDRPRAGSDLPYVIAVDSPACVKYQLSALTSFANKMRKDGSSNAVWRRQPSPPPTFPAPRPRPYLPKPLVILTPLRRPQVNPQAASRTPVSPTIPLAPPVASYSHGLPARPSDRPRAPAHILAGPIAPIPVSTSRPLATTAPRGVRAPNVIVSHTRRLRSTKHHPIRHHELLAIAIYVRKHERQWAKKDAQPRAQHWGLFCKSNPSRSPRAWKAIIKSRAKDIERLIDVLGGHRI